MTERSKPFIARRDGTPENGCPCEGCVFLRSQIGHAMMKWSLSFAAQCKRAVDMGLKPGTSLSITMNGPDARVLVTGGMHDRGIVYNEFSFDPAKLLEEDPGVLIKGPNTDVLLEEYGDDPVLRSLIDWLAKRYGN